jgi:hypothetical protein
MGVDRIKAQSYFHAFILLTVHASVPVSGIFYHVSVSVVRLLHSS